MGAEISKSMVPSNTQSFQRASFTRQSIGGTPLEFYPTGPGIIISAFIHRFEAKGKNLNLYDLPNPDKDSNLVEDAFPKKAGHHHIKLLGKNQTKKGIQNAIEKAIGIMDDDPDKYQFLGLFISSHGGLESATVTEEGKLTTLKVDCIYDKFGDRIFYLDDILSKINGKAAPVLRNKPVLMAFDTCRGLDDNLVVKATGITNNAGEDRQGAHGCFPNISDYVVFFSTVHGCVSYANEKDGSMMISNLCKIIMENRDKDIMELTSRLIARVERQVKQLGNNHDQERTQIPVIHTTLRKGFKPGWSK